MSLCHQKRADHKSTSTNGAFLEVVSVDGSRDGFFSVERGEATMVLVRQKFGQVPRNIRPGKPRCGVR